MAPDGWNTAINEAPGAGSPSQAIFYKIAGSDELKKVKATIVGTKTETMIQIYEYTGIVDPNPLGVVSSNSGNAKKAKSGEITTTYPEELIIVGLTKVTPGAGTVFNNWINGFTEQNDFNNGLGANAMTFGGADFITSEAGDYMTTARSAVVGDWRGQIASFRVLGAASRYPGRSTFPDNISFTINNDSDCTGQRMVSLNIFANGASQMLISNNEDFQKVEWEPYAETKDWVLDIGDGEKKVYALFRNEFMNQSMVIADEIELDTVGLCVDQ